MRRWLLPLACLTLACSLVAAPLGARAMCTYMPPNDPNLDTMADAPEAPVVVPISDAAMVTLMRDGTRTVLSMRVHYEGPAEDFAMVVPVPVVLDESQVTTLPDHVFDRVDQLTAPRLVEYWEANPCPMVRWRERSSAPMLADGASGGGWAEEVSMGDELGRVRPPPVVIEAAFDVSEYEILILSAEDSTGLIDWLNGNGYVVSEEAEPLLRSYIAAGTKFFVARVNIDRVQYEDGQALLSPLRMHYDSETFGLPIRLGLLNADGEQDLVVNILSPGQRYEAANYPNITIPTNIEIRHRMRARFSEFYDALFDRAVEVNPGAVVTEYVWEAADCDDCPAPPLGEEDLLALGADVTPSGLTDYVVTRLHARYDRETAGEDLIFREADPIVGGRQRFTAPGVLESGAEPSAANGFQARYVIFRPWEGSFCGSPRRGQWVGPPEGRGIQAAQVVGLGEREPVPLERQLRQDIPELGIEARRRSRLRQVVHNYSP